LVQELQGILISELDKLKLREHRTIYNSEIFINSLVEHHVINEGAHRVSLGSQPLQPINIDVLKQPVDLLVGRQLLDEDSEELYDVFVVVENAEEEAVEQSHGVLLDVARVLTNALDDLQI